mmetsp:Transcript_8436/g.8608  ORF Transcript_8436/g.8608 Transcript_8436/m.8608 type:complete len:83 (+) Transcript_8436:1294-1542(+)
MMVLWKLENCGAPTFVPQCGACNQEILTGVRYHCKICNPDFDLCGECFNNPVDGAAAEGTTAECTIAYTAVGACFCLHESQV